MDLSIIIISKIYYKFKFMSIINAVDNKNACIPRSDVSSAIRWYASIYHSKTQKSEYLRVKHLDS